MNKITKKTWSLMLVLALLLSLCPWACASEDAAAADEAPFGAPWVCSIVGTNLPAEPPEARDDLYLHYNYETVREHRDGPIFRSMMQADGTSLIRNALSAVMESGSAGDACTAREFEQLEIFYRQAADLDALAEAGISDLRPYLDRVFGAQTIAELNAVLVSEDFPFSPYLLNLVAAYDMSQGYNVFIYPNFLFVDVLLDEAQYYQDSEDERVQAGNDMLLFRGLSNVIRDLGWLELSRDETAQRAEELLALEKTYGKDAPFTSRYREYGEYSASVSNLSLEELAALCPSYPVKETMEKFGLVSSPFYSVLEKNWLASFNAIWTGENLELLKLMTAAKIIHECRPALDPMLHGAAAEILGEAQVDARTNAAAACDQPDSFAQLVSEIYVEKHYAGQDAARLTALSEELIAAFRRVIEQNVWLSADAREKMLLKLEKMRLNVLYPDGGYLDFGGLSLTPSEEGGTLLGNYLKLKEYHRRMTRERIGREAFSRLCWEYFTPSFINCFYDPDTNSINILPGFVASGLYRSDMSEEELLGTFGWVIAHEISHGFDFYGSQIDAFGTPNRLFSEDDLSHYFNTVDKLKAYYDTIEPMPGVFVDGDLIKGEAGADLSGLQLVLAAAEVREDFDYEAFWQAAARLHCSVLSSVDYLSLFLTDTHPLDYLRGNVNAQMFPELYETFDIREGDGMYLAEQERIRFW